MARLKRRGIIWYAWIPQPEGGTKLVSTRCTNKEAAHARAGELERRSVDPGYAAAQDAQSIFTRAVVSDYVQSRVTRGRSVATVKFTRQKAGHLARLLPLRACDVTNKALEAYIETRLEEGVARATIKKELGVFRAAWNFARKKKDVTQDPKIILPELDSDSAPKKRYLQPLELVGIVSLLPPDRGARVAWIVATGARWGESCRAQREDHDFPARLVHLRGTKTKASERRVPIVGVAESLLRWALARAEGDLALFRPWGNVRRDIAQACVRLGIAVATPNDLRRTLATWLREAGIEPGLIATMLGHTTSRMVEQHYGRLSPEGLRDLLAARPVGVLTSPARNLLGETGDLDDSGALLRKKTKEESAEIQWPGPESDRGHADFQSTHPNAYCSDNVGNSEVDCSESVGRISVSRDLAARFFRFQSHRWFSAAEASRGGR